MSMSMSSSGSSRRGLLIVLEGCDRSGKTSLCKRLVEGLNSAQAPEGVRAEAMRFPDRSTQVGQLIDKYLRGQRQLDDRAVHLLFSGNRWERAGQIRRAVEEEGVTLVVDRYAFSGVAFSAAKDGLSLEWCKQPDRGLPRPDLVCFLDVSPEEARKRGGFGEERYENEEFQVKNVLRWTYTVRSINYPVKKKIL